MGDESFPMRCYERISHVRRKGRTIVLACRSLDTIRSLCVGGVGRRRRGARDRRGPGRGGELPGRVHGGRDEDSILAFTGRRFGTGQAVITYGSSTPMVSRRTASAPGNA